MTTDQKKITAMRFQCCGCRQTWWANEKYGNRPCVWCGSRVTEAIEFRYEGDR